MYRYNYNRACCQKRYDEDLVETACSQYGTMAEYYKDTTEDSCDCGFNSNNSTFPSNPMYGQSYVPIQNMSKTFTPCTRFKNGNNLPRIS